MARKIDFSEMTIHDMSMINVHKLTTRQLRAFIRESAPIVEDAMGDDNEQLRKSVRIVGSFMGTRKLHGQTKIVKGYRTATKDELIQRAQWMQSHLAIDVFTHRAEEEEEEISQELMDKINERLSLEGKDKFSEDEMRTFWFVIHQMRSLVTEFGSTDIASLMSSAYKQRGRDNPRTTGMDIVNIIREYYSRPERKGMDKEEFTDYVLNKLKELN